VLVEGELTRRPARDPTVAATRIEESELGRPGASAAEVLSHVPGLQVNETGAASDLATASVRGASSAQTPVYLAGIRLNDDVTGTADLSLVPLWMLSGAEVYRGNAPADADRLGIGGAIFFEPRLPKKTRVGAGLGAGSFGERSAWLGGEVAHGNDGALVALRTAAANNDYPYRDDAGTSAPSDDRTRDRPNADFTSRDAWAIGRSTFGRARLTTVFNAFEREQGVTGLAAVPALSARAESKRELAGAALRFPCSAGSSCEVALTSQALRGSTRLTDPKQELGLLTTRLDSRGSRFGQGARLMLRGDAVSASFAVNAEYERLALDGGSALRATRSTTSARANLQAELTPDTEISALALVSCDQTTGPQQASGCASLSPEGRIGQLQRVGRLELRSNLGSYARVPTLGELYGVSPLVRGSSALQRERGVTFDLGARLPVSLGRVQAYAEVFGFARRVSDLIAYRRTSIGAIAPYNVGEARVVGVELEAGAEWRHHFRSNLALTWLDPRDTTQPRGLTNDLVPFQARFQGSLFVEAFAEWSGSGVSRAGLDGRLSERASRLADPAGLIVLPASTQLDLGGSLRFGDGCLALRAAVDDLLDARHFDVIGYPLPGRSVHATLDAWF